VLHWIYVQVKEKLRFFANPIPRDNVLV
jgi:hypothetical protein